MCSAAAPSWPHSGGTRAVSDDGDAFCRVVTEATYGFFLYFKMFCLDLSYVFNEFRVRVLGIRL